MPPSVRPTLRAPAPTAWARTSPPVVRGARPGSSLTLTDLADAGAVAHLGTHRPDLSRRHRALTPVHLAVQALPAAVLAPSAVDGLVVEAPADRVGVLLTAAPDGGPQVDAVWVDDEVRARPGGAATAGAALAALLDPVLALARRRGRIGDRTATALAEDSLVLRGVPYQAVSGDPLWLRAFLTGAGYSSPRPPRSVTAHPDDGPPVVLPARRVCCVLSVHPDADSCPSCPLIAAQEQPGLVEQWLGGIDEAEFRHLAGRPRAGRTR